jgi:hypothetical protein
MEMVILGDTTDKVYGQQKCCVLYKEEERTVNSYFDTV